MRVAVLLNIAPSTRILDADRTKHNDKRRAGNPFLPMRGFRNLCDQVTVGDHTKSPGLFVSARRGKTRGFEHFLNDFFRDRSVLESADTRTFS